VLTIKTARYGICQASDCSSMRSGRGSTARKARSRRRLKRSIRTLATFGSGARLTRNSKLVVSWRLGPRDLATAYDFTHDLAERVSQRIQITTDGLRVYLEAVESAFYEDVDYAVLHKIYGNDIDAARRYSPAKIVSSTLAVITGTPDPKHISTSYVERLNWSTRTSMRRYTRLSNGFSRKIENHEAAVALNYFAYNFNKIHRTLRTSPAMAAGVTTKLWEVSDLVALLEESELRKAA
jgi:IS1 family transposase